MITSENLCDRPVAPGRLIRMNSVDQSPDTQFLIAYQLEYRLLIYTGAVDLKQLTLSLHRDLWIFVFDHLTAFFCFVRLEFEHLFF